MTLSTIGNSYLVQTGYISLQNPQCLAYLLLEPFCWSDITTLLFNNHLKSRALVTGTNGSAASISVCLTSLTPCITLNDWNDTLCELQHRDYELYNMIYLARLWAMQCIVLKGAFISEECTGKDLEGIQHITVSNNNYCFDIDPKE